MLFHLGFTSVFSLTHSPLSSPVWYCKYEGILFPAKTALPLCLLCSVCFLALYQHVRWEEKKTVCVCVCFSALYIWLFFCLVSFSLFDSLLLICVMMWLYWLVLGWESGVHSIISDAHSDPTPLGGTWRCGRHYISHWASLNQFWWYCKWGYRNRCLHSALYMSWHK